MATRRQVRCINKSNRFNPYERITHIGGKYADGTAWKYTEQAAIQGMDDGKWEFFVTVNGKEVDVIIDSRNGKRYLKTTADGVQPNNLLSLPECP